MVVSLRRAARRATVILCLVLGAYLFFHSHWYLRLTHPLYYRGLIARYCVEHGLDPFLVAAIVRAESRFRPGAASEKGALGLMQVMPDTGRWAALELGIEPYGPEMLCDPEVNIRIGTWYLALLRREFPGDTVIALAAYNAGLGNVRKWLDDELWTGRPEEVDRIPFPETREYVKKVLRLHDGYRRAYGGRWPG